MQIPGFTAEDSLYKSSGHHQTNRHAIKSSRQMIRTVYAAETRGGEVIKVHGCAPGYIEVGSGDDAFCTPGPSFWWDGMGGGKWRPTDLPPGGGGGGGGGGEPTGGGTKNMDDACSDAANSCKIISTLTKRCAVLRCKKDYCGPEHEDAKCTADEKHKSREWEAEYNAPNCDAAPCIPKEKNSSVGNLGVHRFSRQHRG